jgi:hypothetical protein
MGSTNSIHRDSQNTLNKRLVQGIDPIPNYTNGVPNYTFVPPCTGGGCDQHIKNLGGNYSPQPNIYKHIPGIGGDYTYYDAVRKALQEGKQTGHRS